MTDKVKVRQVDEDRASAYVKKPVGFLDGEDPATVRFTHAQLSRVLSLHRAAAEASARKAALEEAATVAVAQYEGHSQMFCTNRAANYEHAGRRIATAIRALAEKGG